MAFYETVFIARQDISAKQAEELASKFSQVVTDNGGSVKKTESWGLRNLAYKINKNKKGHYTLFHIDAESSVILEMERLMRIDEDILRYLTVRMDEMPEEDTVMMKSINGGGSDDDRKSRGARR